MPYRSIFNALLAHEGIALFEFRDDGVFVPLIPVSAWCKSVWPIKRGKPIRLGDSSPFLENFMTEAEEFWASKSLGSVNSGNWIERDPSGNETPLEAFAFRLVGKRVLLIRNLSATFAEQQQVLQTARESLLANEQLIRETQKKEILLHCIIHDLSQPLTAMRGCFDLLLGQELSPESQKILLTGRRESQRQERMIREILDAFSADVAAQQSGVHTSTDSADLAACARRAAEQFLPAFTERGVHLELAPYTDCDHGSRVTGDATRIERIFGNLLENALRYTPRGSSVTVGVEDAGTFLLAFVDDGGPGLRAESSPDQIFALFGKGKDRPGKAGLGLYFCKMTVERWGGSIGAENRSAGGSRFWFRLPRASHESTEKPQEAQASTQAAPPKSLCVLVAEDNETVRELAVELLRARGHSPVPVSDGRAALAAFEVAHPDVVLLDQQMPRMSGLEAARAIREKEGKSGARRALLVGVSGSASEEDKRQALEAGMDAFLSKPFDKTTLFAAVETPFAANVASTESLATTKPPSEGLPAHLERMTGGNKELMRKLAVTFLSDLPAKLAAIQKAVAQTDPRKVSSAAHSLKGALGIVSPANGPIIRARNIENMGRNRNLRGAAEELKALSGDLDRLKRELESLFGNLLSAQTKMSD